MTSLSKVIAWQRLTTSMAFLRRQAVKPPGFYRRLNSLTTADFGYGWGRSPGCNRNSSRLEVGEDEPLPEGCHKVDRVVAKRASVVSAS